MLFPLRIPFYRKTYKSLNNLLISKSALKHNYRELQHHHPQCAICPVLKSNAYGHGIKLVAPVVDAFKPPYICVDSLFEAYELYRYRIQSQVFIMGYTNPENLRIKKLPFAFSVFDQDTVKMLSRFQPNAQVHIKIDTGMSRYGLKISELRSYVRFIKTQHVQVVGLWSHFADADNPKSRTMIAKQLAAYKQGLRILQNEGINPTWRHISNSSGAYKVFDSVFTMIRTGGALYGIDQLQTDDPAHSLLQLQPVATVTSTITQIKTIQKGDTVGYNNTYAAKKKVTLAVLPIGYFDGVDRRLSNCGFVEVHGHACPIIGRVSMNITTIDISAVSDTHVGDTCIVYSNNPQSPCSIRNQAYSAHTIPDDLLAHLNPTIHRELVA